MSYRKKNCLKCETCNMKKPRQPNGRRGLILNVFPYLVSAMNASSRKYFENSRSVSA